MGFNRLSLLLLFVLSASPLYAQSEILPADVQERIAKQAGVELDSVEMRKLILRNKHSPFAKGDLSGIREQFIKVVEHLGGGLGYQELKKLRNAISTRDHKADYYMQLPKPRSGPVRVIRHLKSDHGIPFPRNNALVLPDRYAQIGLSEEYLKSWVMKGLEMAKVHAGSLPVPPKLRRCNENKTVMASTGVKDQRIKKIVLLDMVFLDEDPPLNVDEIFGQRTSVFKYEDKPNHGVSIVASQLGIRCLPARIRATPGYAIRDRGINALKNYDRDPTGKGKLHPYMVAKLEAEGVTVGEAER